MDIPASRWFPAIRRRRSRRSFDPDRSIGPDTLAALQDICQEFTPFAHARTVLVNRPSIDIFKGAVGSYGKISGAPAFIAFIGDMEAPSSQEEVGYAGEGIVLEATALGLNTCWVAGFFRRESVAALIEIKENERVLSVTPVGYASGYETVSERLMTGFGLSHQRLPLSRLVRDGGYDNQAEWIKASLEAARLAPSAINRQPWGFEVDNNGILVFVRTGGTDFNVSKRLDCGISMLHIEVAAAYFGRKGRWEMHKDPEVAKFIANS
jgi:nitroreductase